MILETQSLEKTAIMTLVLICLNYYLLLDSSKYINSAPCSCCNWLCVCFACNSCTSADINDDDEDCVLSLDC